MQPAIRTLGYARVSTGEQNLDLQLDALNAAGCDRVYRGVGSGTIAERPQLALALGHLRAGDTLVVPCHSQPGTVTCPRQRWRLLRSRCDRSQAGSSSALKQTGF